MESPEAARSSTSFDDESDPKKAVENVNKLIKQDKVDVIIGTVHSRVAIAMAKVVRETGTLMIDPNAGANEITGSLCAPNIFRVSFSNWQPGYAMGKVAGILKQGKSAVTVSWDYAAGRQMVEGFNEAFTESGGKVIKDLWIPFPESNFKQVFDQLAELKPDLVYAFIGGPPGVKFLKEYAASGLKRKIPLYGPGFLTEGTLEPNSKYAERTYTALHYGDDLFLKKNIEFRDAYFRAYKKEPNVFSVQGYDAAALLQIGLERVGGDMKQRGEMIHAMETATIDSPRGFIKLSAAHNPIQAFYLRRVRGVQNRVITVAAHEVNDPARGCNMVRQQSRR